ncbi:MAG: methionyl-tRNA formyltransferase [Bacillota bacterium]
MRIVFLGSPDFAVPSLQKLHEDDDIEIELVVTQPPRKKGRGQKLRSTSVGQTAKQFGLELLETENINDSEVVHHLKKIDPDYLVVVAFGQILSEQILEIAQQAPINLHASLLPKYRGASPIHQSIIQGDDKTGVTTMLISPDLDQGDILLQEEIDIKDEDTAGSLHDLLAVIGADLLVKTLREYDQDKIEPKAQDDSKSSYAPLLSKKDGLIDFAASTEEVFNFIRGNNPWPGAYTFYKGQKLKVLRSKRVYIQHSAEPGQIIKAEVGDGLLVATQDGAVNLTEIQLPGSKVISARDFICGYQPEEGLQLGK